MTQTTVKILISLVVIIACVQIAKRFPSLGGLISVMPLTGALVLIWAYLDKPGNTEHITQLCMGSLWGILPSILFFIAALICFKKSLGLWLVLPISFAVWTAAAFVHQLLLSDWLAK